MRHLFIAVAISVFAGSACGDGDSTPTTPTPPTPGTPTVSGVTVSGLDAIRTGFFSDYTATVSLSDGTTQTVTPTWSVDNANATVNAEGRLSGVGHGAVTITATYQGRSGTKTVSIVNNYGGNWSGTYVIRKCDQSGVFTSVRWCREAAPVGGVGPFSLMLDQTGNDRSQISGTISEGTISGNISGNVTGDGRLNIGGTFTVIASGVTFTNEIGGWDSRVSGASGMVGGWAENLRAVNVTGNAYQENEIVTATHLTQQATLNPAPLSYTLTWPEFMSRLREAEIAPPTPDLLLRLNR